MSLFFTACKLDAKTKSFGSVFSTTETNAHIFPDSHYSGDEANPARANPDYMYAFDTCFSNQNAYLILDALGYKDEEPCFSTPIAEFIEKGQAYLDTHLPPRLGTGDYILEQIGRIVLMAKVGEGRGAEYLTVA